MASDMMIRYLQMKDVVGINRKKYLVLFVIALLIVTFGETIVSFLQNKYMGLSTTISIILNLRGIWQFLLLFVITFETFDSNNISTLTSCMSLSNAILVNSGLNQPLFPHVLCL